MGDRRLGREPGVGAAKILADARQEAREALHVELVDHRLVPGAAQELIAFPLERLIDHDRLRDRGGVVARVDHEVVAVRVGERAPAIPQHRPFDRLCVRVDQQLVRIEPVTALRSPRPVDAVAVELPGPDTVEVAVPVVGGLPGQLTPCLDAGGVEEAQLDALGVLRAQREVRAAAVPARAERERLSGPGAHRLTLTPATGGAPRSAYPAASAARSPRSAQTEKTTASRRASPKLSRDLSRVAGEEAPACSEGIRDRVELRDGMQRAAEQRQGHVHRSEEEKQEHRHLHQRSRLDRAESHRDPGRPEEAAGVDDQREGVEPDHVDRPAAHLHPGSEGDHREQRRRDRASAASRPARIRARCPSDSVTRASGAGQSRPRSHERHRSP